MVFNGQRNDNRKNDYSGIYRAEIQNDIFH
jgi:hypothetical protein